MSAYERPEEGFVRSDLDWMGVFSLAADRRRSSRRARALVGQRLCVCQYGPMDEAAYEAKARVRLAAWRAETLKPAGPLGAASKTFQKRIARLIPEKVHGVITGAIEGMTRTMLVGADFTTPAPVTDLNLQEREALAMEKITGWRLAAAAEGGVAGAGGFLLAAADFPALIALKFKLLFDLAAVFGHSTRDLRERLYILAIFQLAFSSPDHRARVLAGMEDWDARAPSMPATFEDYDWRAFQQEYRDYIDLAKLAQLIPGIGAPVGVMVNFSLLDRLGKTAINAYRMRWLGP